MQKNLLFLLTTLLNTKYQLVLKTNKAIKEVMNAFSTKLKILGNIWLYITVSLILILILVVNLKFYILILNLYKNFKFYIMVILF